MWYWTILLCIQTHYQFVLEYLLFVFDGHINIFLNYTSILDETKGPVEAPGGVKKGRSTDYYSPYLSTYNTQQLAWLNQQP